MFEQFFTVKNILERGVVVWVKSTEDIEVVTLADGSTKHHFKGVWELEDGSRKIEPIQIAVLKRPFKIMFLFKVKDDSNTSAKKTLIKTYEILDPPKNAKIKFYETENLVPNSKLG